MAKFHLKRPKPEDIKVDAQASIGREPSAKEARFMKEAIKLSTKSVGTVRGAVLVHNGKVIEKAYNQDGNNLILHPIMQLIMQGEASIGRDKLKECEVYTSNAPCPMCFGALHLAGIKKLYYGAYPIDMHKAGYPDLKIFEILAGRDVPLQIEVVNILREEAVEKLPIKGDDKES